MYQMKTKACPRKAHGLQQRVTVIICTNGSALNSCHVSGLKKKKAAIFGLCLSLVVEGLAN